MSTTWMFEDIENKHTVCKGKDCINKLFEFLKEPIINIINFEKTT